jgi:hypothetical protein
MLSLESASLLSCVAGSAIATRMISCPHCFPLTDGLGRHGKVEKAITYFDAALRVYSKQGPPERYIETTEHLSLARAALAEMQLATHTDPAK